MLKLDALLERRPTQLSGGQRQRVAIGRAIVREPTIFLFDEPLSNLDAELRVAMRAEISGLHQRLGTTMIYVTHDQVEAMTMADRIVVLRGGRVEQIGAPLELYNRPCNRFVAGFIGSPQMNFLGGRVAGIEAAGVRIALRRRRRGGRTTRRFPCSPMRPRTTPASRSASGRSTSRVGPSARQRRWSSRRRSSDRSSWVRRAFSTAGSANGDALTVHVAGPARPSRAATRSPSAFRPPPRCCSTSATASARCRDATPRRADAMEPLVAGSFAGREADGAVFDLGNGWRCRIFVLADDLFRVLFCRHGQLKEPRSWTIAPAGVDVPWEGRDRLDASVVSAPAVRRRSRGEDDDRARHAANAAGGAPATLRARMASARPQRRLPPIAPRRPTSGASAAACCGTTWRARRPTSSSGSATRRVRSTSTAGACVRSRSTRSATTARPPTRCTSTGRSCSRATRETGVSLRHVLRHAGGDDVRPRLRVRQLPRLLPLRRDRRRRPRLLRLRRVRACATSCASSPTSPAGMAFGPRWSLGYANTAMSLTDAPDAQAQLAGFAAKLIEHDVPAVGVPLRLRLYEPRQAPLRVHVESRQVSRSARGDRALRDAERAHRGQPQALPARRSSGVSPRSARAAPSSATREPAAPCVGPVLGRVGRAPRLHESGRHRVVAAGIVRGRCSTTASTPGGTTTTSTRSGTISAPRTASATRSRSSDRGRCTRC